MNLILNIDKEIVNLKIRYEDIDKEIMNLKIKYKDIDKENTKLIEYKNVIL